jgi:hypothetical protein
MFTQTSAAVMAAAVLAGVKVSDLGTAGASGCTEVKSLM